MQSLSHYASAISTAQLRLPDNAQFSVDGRRIAQAATSMAAKLPKPDPAVIINITRVSDSLPSVSEFSKLYQRPAQLPS
ncbi:MAG: hypothetical protein EB114_09445 [Betaproteobacteria bacterium]|nr:hypothetical protein [Pseudomonadota bacterium]NBO12840.1 hypothetical protein [Betaproteobacteria bacterium]NBP11105.1 hypothetical protein [Betaproteobacteria bacterium]NBP61559.1 hypothetical protein [Betaproteobacteria bacterium]NBQ08528.1 hypothetical protein [Betaproteobacteria bacterium]